MFNGKFIYPFTNKPPFILHCYCSIIVIIILLIACGRVDEKFITEGLNITLVVDEGEDIKQYEHAIQKVKLQVFSEDRNYPPYVTRYTKRLALAPELVPVLGNYKVVASYLDEYNNTLFIGELDGIQFTNSTTDDCFIRMEPTWRVTDSAGTIYGENKIIITTVIELAEEYAQKYNLTSYYIAMSHMINIADIPKTTGGYFAKPIMDYENPVAVRNLRHNIFNSESTMELVGGNGYITIKTNDQVFILKETNAGNLEVEKIATNITSVATNYQSLFMLTNAMELYKYKMQIIDGKVAAEFSGMATNSFSVNQKIIKLIATKSEKCIAMTENGLVFEWDGFNMEQIGIQSLAIDIACFKDKLAILCGNKELIILDIENIENIKVLKDINDVRYVLFYGNHILYTTYDKKLYLLDPQSLRAILVKLYNGIVDMPVDRVNIIHDYLSELPSYAYIRSSGAEYIVQIPAAPPQVDYIFRSGYIPVDTLNINHATKANITSFERIYFDDILQYTVKTNGDSQILKDMNVQWEVVKQPKHANLVIFAQYRQQEMPIKNGNTNIYCYCEMHNTDDDGNVVGMYSGEVCLKFKYEFDDIIFCSNETFTSGLHITRFFPAFPSGMYVEHQEELDIDSQLKSESNIYKIYEPSCGRNTANEMAIDIAVQSSFDCMLAYSDIATPIDPYETPNIEHIPIMATKYRLSCNDDGIHEDDYAQFIIQFLPCPPQDSGFGGSGSLGTGSVDSSGQLTDVQINVP